MFDEFVTVVIMDHFNWVSVPHSLLLLPSSHPSSLLLPPSHPPSLLPPSHPPGLRGALKVLRLQAL